MRSGFFNSEITGYDGEGMPIFDRAEDAEFYAEYFNSFIGNGMFPNPSTNFQALAGGSMKLNIQPGKCWINGYFGWSDLPEHLTLDLGDTLDRVDRIVLQLDLRCLLSSSAKKIQLQPGAFPAGPIRLSAHQIGVPRASEGMAPGKQPKRFQQVGLALGVAAPDHIHPFYRNKFPRQKVSVVFKRKRLYSHRASTR